MNCGRVVWLGWSLSLRSTAAAAALNPPKKSQPNPSIPSIKRKQWNAFDWIPFQLAAQLLAAWGGVSFIPFHCRVCFLLFHFISEKKDKPLTLHFIHFTHKPTLSLFSLNFFRFFKKWRKEEKEKTFRLSLFVFSRLLSGLPAVRPLPPIIAPRAEEKTKLKLHSHPCRNARQLNSFLLSSH